jgi:hypothetical protein
VPAHETVLRFPKRMMRFFKEVGNDFWLFDGALVLFNYFSGDGAAVGAELRDEPAIIKLCGSAFEAVWDRAVPHEDYRPA